MCKLTTSPVWFAQFTVIDAGYTATDHGLGILFGKPECRYISVTNADNAYGSHIVDSVLNGELFSC
jgi:hypothetical protein